LILLAHQSPIETHPCAVIAKIDILSITCGPKKFLVRPIGTRRIAVVIKPITKLRVVSRFVVTSHSSREADHHSFRAQITILSVTPFIERRLIASIQGLRIAIVVYAIAQFKLRRFRVGAHKNATLANKDSLGAKVVVITIAGFVEHRVLRTV
tara:strand:+ start:184 stop:642 length:459 start_codon:yes stop_codon:yes gene_type:complete